MAKRGRAFKYEEGTVLKKINWIIPAIWESEIKNYIKEICKKKKDEENEVLDFAKFTLTQIYNISNGVYKGKSIEEIYEIFKKEKSNEFKSE